MTLGYCGGWRGIDVFAVNVCCVGDEGGASITAFSVALFEAEKLNFLRDEVENINHFDGGVVAEFRMWPLRGAQLQRGIGW